MFTAEQRTKEIGIRKTLGATAKDIITLLSANFLKPVAIAFFIAFPISWLATYQWLQGFTYRVNISLSVFVLAGFIAVLIALITVSFQSFKAAIANPVKSLRTE